MRERGLGRESEKERASERERERARERMRERRKGEREGENYTANSHKYTANYTSNSDIDIANPAMPLMHVCCGQAIHMASAPTPSNCVTVCLCVWT